CQCFFLQLEQHVSHTHGFASSWLVRGASPFACGLRSAAHCIWTKFTNQLRSASSLLGILSQKNFRPCEGAKVMFRGTTLICALAP
ncbi:MAG: hypothetical protein IJV18_11335, partial [Acidaminococcaceae bacterium]|nr:hypothetical protein [Acidaminococcaceae bacterium]